MAATFDKAFDLFPSSDDDSRVLHTNIYLTIRALAYKCVDVQFYISVCGVFLTLFHLLILTRKPMMTSSIMSIMICTAICDLLSMIELICVQRIIVTRIPSDCVPPISLFILNIFDVLQSIRDDLIRCSTWLSVLMALIRYSVLKLASNPARSQRLACFSFGFIVFGIALTISTVFSIFYFFKLKIDLTGEWSPAEHCPDQSIGTLPVYETHISDLFSFHDGIVHRVFMFLNGTTAKILPCILFPLLTILLISELRTTQNKRRESTVSLSDKNKAERTTGLVIFMSVSFFIALLPSGVMTSLAAVYTDVGFLYMTNNIDHICYTLLTLNATLHCFICFAMSSQYRRTVSIVLKLPNNRKNSVVTSSFNSRLT